MHLVWSPDNDHDGKKKAWGPLEGVENRLVCTTKRSKALLEHHFTCGRTVVEKFEFVPQGGWKYW